MIKNPVLYADLYGKVPYLDEVIENNGVKHFDNHVMYVDINSKSSVEDGTQKNPFKSLRGAVNAIPAYCHCVQINLADGEYNEDITVYRRSLLLELNGISGNADAVRVRSFWCNVERFSTHNITYYGKTADKSAVLRVDHAHSVTIVKCKIVNEASSDTGILINLGTAQIEQNTIEGFKYGISAGYGSQVYLYQNTLKNCTNGLCSSASVMYDYVLNDYSGCTNMALCKAGMVVTNTGIYKNDAKGNTVLI